MQKEIDEVLGKIREVCDLKRLEFGCEVRRGKSDDTGKVYWNLGHSIEAMFGDSMDAFEIDSRHLEIIGLPVQLNHLLWAVGKDQDEIAIEGQYLLLPFTTEYYFYDLQKSVEQNLNDNSDLTKWLHEILVNKK